MSIKKNFIYSSFLTAANYIFPLLTFPYVSRVLGVESIGKYNFVDNIIQIFIIVSMLGIQSIGVREIAQNKSSQERLNKTFTAIVTINALFTFCAILVLYLLLYIVPKFHDYNSLLIVGSLKLLSTFLLIDWFYKGLEEFKFITLRTLVIKILYVISVFIFVRNPEDYVLYYFLIVISVTINAIVNISYARKYVKFQLDRLEIKRVLIPILIMGGYSILAWLYNSFSTSYLGFISTDEQVGYYSTATKLYSIILSIFTAFTAVMLPRLSQLISEKRYEEFNSKIHKSFNVIITSSIPFIVFAIIFSRQIIELIAGDGYEGAIAPMIVVLPIVLVVGIEQLLIVQIMMPLKMEREVMINTIWGAVTGLILNVLIVPHLLCVGAAICWLASELVVMSSAIYFIRKKTDLNLPGYMLIQRLLPIILIIASTYIIHFYTSGVPDFIRLCISGIAVALVTYAVEKYLIKNPIIEEVDKIVKSYIFRKCNR